MHSYRYFSLIILKGYFHTYVLWHLWQSFYIRERVSFLINPPFYLLFSFFSDRLSGDRHYCNIRRLCALKQKKPSRRDKYVPNNARASVLPFVFLSFPSGIRTFDNTHGNGTSYRIPFRSFYIVFSIYGNLCLLHSIS